MEYFFVVGASFGAALLTFFSGFGLGTLLMPVVALFFPVDIAVAITAVVHLANNLFKLALVGRFAHRPALLRFGVPALLAAFVGAWLLEQLAAVAPLASYQVLGVEAELSPVKLLVGLLILVFVFVELSPALKARRFPARWMPVGGCLSGFLGGLSGHQGALRSMFLVKAGLSREAFLGTGVVIAVMVDVARLVTYGGMGMDITTTPGLIAVAIAAAFAGSWLASRFISKVTIPGIQNLVSVLLLVIAAGLISGLI